MKWKQRAVDVIQQALADAKTQNLNEADTLKLVDSRYPFGNRAMHPYKVWLAVRRELVTKTPASPNGKATRNTAERLAAWNAGKPR